MPGEPPRWVFLPSGVSARWLCITAPWLWPQLLPVGCCVGSWGILLRLAASPSHSSSYVEKALVLPKPVENALPYLQGARAQHWWASPARRTVTAAGAARGTAGGAAPR